MLIETKSREFKPNMNLTITTLTGVEELKREKKNA